MKIIERCARVGRLVRRDCTAHPHPNPKRCVSPSCVARLDEFTATDFAGADEGGGALELLGGEEPQRVPHQHPDAAFAGVTCHNPLKPPHRKGEGGEPEVRLGLAAARREEQEVGCSGVELSFGMGWFEQ